ncbi:uncharacterized protein LOC144015031 [Festucalex cinctus]
MADISNDLKMLRGSFHIIPSGRQLPRTPPWTGVKKRLDFCKEEKENVNIVACQQDAEGDDGDRPPPNTITFNTSDTKPAGFLGYADSLVNGMKGYQVTAADLDFIRTMQVGKRVKQLQGMLEVLQNDVKVLENVQADLKEFSTCLELVAHQQRLFGALTSSVKGFELEFKSLMAAVNEDVDKKQEAVNQNKKKKTNRKKVDTKEREQLVEQFGGGQVHQLMKEWSEVKSKVAQLELACGKVVPAAASKAAQPTSRKATNEDTRKSKDKPTKSPTKSAPATIPKAAAAQQQIVADESELAKGTRGRPKAVRRAKAAASQAESTKEQNDAKNARPTRRRVKQQQQQQQQQQEGEIVLRRSKRIANRQ